MSHDTRRIYVASSWRNTFQVAVVTTLRVAGFEVYDFRNPEEGDDGFHWSNIDPEWTHWNAEQFTKALDNPIAIQGFAKDMKAMEWADTFVLVLPCGRSAHLELGWAVGQQRKTAILLHDNRLFGDAIGEAEYGIEPELMYRMVDHLAPTLFDLLGWLGVDDNAKEDAR